ncbi:von Willebrand factor-like [Xenopus laevis]|uniref:von Willebrand factor-like n=2 Tax=Xenopus laevis TaxID=8355 RepID=A0A1L8FPR1_XENLA|nr:von Willebrand factor-like [Xenopus laevis]OCT73565.1 hypothetical protein XELAEV_18036544mg [Xenopus laevis]
MMGTWQMSSSLSLLVMVMLFGVFVQSQPKVTRNPCPSNMIYGCVRTCYGNCDSLNSTIDVCNKMCKIGCDCKEGFVFKGSNDSKTCVRVSACKVSCPKLMKFIPCYKELRKTCNTMNKPSVHLNTCTPRCVCNKGYILSNERIPRCIKISECPKKPVN